VAYSLQILISIQLASVVSVLFNAPRRSSSRSVRQLMKERELLIKSVVNLILAVVTRSLAARKFRGFLIGATWVVSLVCGGWCRSHDQRHRNSRFTTAKVHSSVVVFSPTAPSSPQLHNILLPPNEWFPQHLAFVLALNHFITCYLLQSFAVSNPASSCHTMSRTGVMRLRCMFRTSKGQLLLSSQPKTLCSRNEKSRCQSSSSSNRGP
jgi:hypothetical protein